MLCLESNQLRFYFKVKTVAARFGPNYYSKMGCEVVTAAWQLQWKPDFGDRARIYLYKTYYH